MNVAGLIEELSKIEDKTKTVEFMDSDGFQGGIINVTIDENDTGIVVLW